MNNSTLATPIESSNPSGGNPPHGISVLNRTDWLEQRKRGIGGSDAAAAVGLSPYKTPHQLYLEKRGEVEPEDISDKEAVIWGNNLEDVVAQEFARRTGRKVARVNSMLVHPDYPFMLASIDRRVVGERTGLEVKTAGQWAASSEQWGPSGSDEVPPQYLVQAQHYLSVSGYDRWDLAVLIGGQDFRIYTIMRDEALISKLVELEAAFWRDVQNGTPPQFTTTDEVRALFPKSIPKAIEADDDLAGTIQEAQQMKGEIKAATSRLEALKAIICGYMEDHDTLTYLGATLATWKSGERKGYTVEPTTTRTLLLKDVK